MADPADPDAALMLRVQRGDREAFAELVTRWRQPVFSFVLRSLRDETEAEDVAQAAFVQAWKAARRYKPRARFSTWLFTIARNLCLNEIRRRARHPADSMDAPAAAGWEHARPQVADAGQPRPSDALLHQELESRLAAALSDLPENQRTAILLCQREELSYEEIAAVLGCSVSATKSLIFRGRETLKHRLKRYLHTGEWPNRGGGRAE